MLFLLLREATFLPTAEKRNDKKNNFTSENLKEYIKPIIINIKTCNDDTLCAFVSASLYDYNKVDPDENIADEDDKPIIVDGIIWND